MAVIDSETLPEFSLIDRLAGHMRVKRADVALGIGDDAALVNFPPSGNQQLVSATDTLVEGTHFLSNASAASIGHRALATNLSDLAAMGAIPAWANLSLTLPEIDPVWLDEFADAFATLAAQHDVALIGGDTVRGPCSVTVTLQGTVPVGKCVLRSGAQSGDLIFVTGMPGAAAAGRQGIADDLEKAFLFPEPRVDFGKHIAPYVNAMIDISDGIVPDIGHVLEKSHAGARLVLDELMLPQKLDGVCDQTDALDLCLFGGEDLELLFTVSPAKLNDIETIAHEQACELTRLGEVTDAGQFWSWQGKEINVAAKGFRHF
ncbi:MAG: thiamine-phosphate kinase [Gammaproteobacteria bacterium]